MAMAIVYNATHLLYFLTKRVPPRLNLSELISFLDPLFGCHADGGLKVPEGLLRVL